VSHRWTVEKIRSLPQILEAARLAGRALLLASDHGHVPQDNMVSVGTFPDSRGRFRPLHRDDEVLADYEVAVRSSAVWTPPGAKGCVLIADDAHRYGGGGNAGEHGGGSLAEVVVPCLLVGCEDMARIDERDDLGVRAAFVPPWWHFEVASTRKAKEPAKAKDPAKSAKKEPSTQLSLLGPLELTPLEPAPVKTTAQSRSPLGERTLTLSETPVFGARMRGKSAGERERVLRAVDFLVERHGVSSEKAFADALGVLPRQVGGIVSMLQEVLNLDGYSVIRLDITSRQVHLDWEKLVVQFEVKS
jgi:hypothetical protein